MDEITIARPVCETCGKELIGGVICLHIKWEWISVTEALPDFETDVLTHNESDYNICKLKKPFDTDDSCQSLEWMDGECYYREVTHWMPLPKPPEKKLKRYTTPAKQFVQYMGEYERPSTTEDEE